MFAGGFEKLRRAEHEAKGDVRFSKRDFPTYAWSIPTLDGRLRYFNIFYTDRNVTLDEVKDAVGKELENPVNFLKLQAMTRNLKVHVPG